MKKFIFCVLILILFPYFVYSDNFSTPYIKVKSYLQTQFEEKNADAVILLRKTKLIWNEDESITKIINLIVKIKTDKGKEKYGDIKLKFNEKYDQIEWGELYTLTKDQKRIDIAKNAINIYTPSIYQDAEMFLKIKMAVVSFSNLEKDSVIVYNVKIKSNKDKYNGYFFGNHIFKSKDPIYEDIFELEYPKSRRVKIKLKNNKLQKVKIKKIISNSKIIEIFKAKEIEGFTEEDFMPCWEDLFPYLIFSSFSSWEEVRNFLKREDIDFDVTKFKNYNIKSLYSLFSEKIKTIYVSLDDLLYIPKDLDFLEKNNIGTPLSKCWAFSKILLNKGINADIVFVCPSWFPFDKDIPSPNQFKFVASYIIGKGEFILPWSEFLTYKDDTLFNEAMCLALFSDRLFLNKKKTKENEISAEFNLNLRENSIDCLVKIKAKGEFAKDLRFNMKYEKEDILKRYFESSVNAISKDAILEEYTLKHVKDNYLDPEVYIKFSLPDFLIKEGDFKILELIKIPINFLNIPLKDLIKYKERKFDILIRYPIKLRISYFINLDKNQIFYLPENEKKSMNNILSWSLKTFKKQNKVFIFKELKIRKRKISKKKYQELKNILSEFLNPKYEVLILSSDFTTKFSYINY